MKTLWIKLKATGLIAVCWMLGSISLGIVITNTLKLPQSNLLTKAGLIGVGLLFNTFALADRRRLWIGLMSPLYLIGILLDLFWQESVPFQIMLITMALIILIPITFFSIPSAKQPKPPTT